MPATRLHLEPGAAAVDHHFRAELTATMTATEDLIGVVHESVAQTTTRFGNAFPGSGFRQTCREYRLFGLSLDYARLEFPALGIDLTVNGTISRVEIDDAEMTAALCGNWTLAFTDLRWYVDGVLIYTHSTDGTMGAGPYALTGSDYHQKENQTRVEAYCVTDPVPESRCGAVPPRAFYVYVLASNLGGWGWWDSGGAVWIGEPITIDALTCPATVWPAMCLGSCTCTYALPSVSETDSYNVTVTAESYFLVTITSNGVRVCLCPNGANVNSNSYRITIDGKSRRSWVDAINENDATLHRSIRIRKAGCSCNPLGESDYTYSETDTTDAITYCPHLRTCGRLTKAYDCNYPTDPCPIPPDFDDGHAPDPACPELSPSSCYYACTVSQSIIEPCTCAASAPSITETSDGLWVEAYVCDTTIFTGWADQSHVGGVSLAWRSTSTLITGTSPDIGVYSKGGRRDWFLVYADAGAVHLVRSQNWGASWSVAVTVAAAGDVPRVDVTADGRVFVTYRNGTNVYSRLYDASLAAIDGPNLLQAVDVASAHDIASYSGSQNHWTQVLVYVSAATIVAKTSVDGKVFS